jgi:hypothetical protein
MSLVPPRCTCDQREHACSPPCRAHPERGGGLGNPGRAISLDNGSTDGGFFTDYDTVLPREPIFNPPPPPDIDEMRRAHENRQELLAEQAREREAAVRAAAHAEATRFADETAKRWEPPPD